MTEGRPKVLVVDDEQPLRELVVVTLGDAFACTEAAGGAEALAWLRAERFDVVLLDVMMPGLSGLDVLRELRSDPSLRELPVVVMSAWQSQDDIANALAAGAHEFLSKPFRVEELPPLVARLAGRAA